jgi:hypothetical protein
VKPSSLETSTLKKDEPVTNAVTRRFNERRSAIQEALTPLNIRHGKPSITNTVYVPGPTPSNFVEYLDAKDESSLNIEMKVSDVNKGLV